MDNRRGAVQSYLCGELFLLSRAAARRQSVRREHARHGSICIAPLPRSLCCPFASSLPCAKKGSASGMAQILTTGSCARQTRGEGQHGARARKEREREREGRTHLLEGAGREDVERRVVRDRHDDVCVPKTGCQRRAPLYSSRRTRKEGKKRGEAGLTLVRRPLRDDLARLDVPHDDLVVLGAAHEVRAVGRQDRRDAVPAGGRAGQPLERSGASRAEQGGGRRRRRERDALAVLVPLVRLDDLVVLVVPQPHGRVERAREQELRVGREAHARDGRVVLVRERLEALARRGVPDAAVRAREGGRRIGEGSQDRATGKR